MNKNSVVLLGFGLLVASVCWAADDKKHFVVQTNGYQSSSQFVQFLHTRYCMSGGLDMLNSFAITRYLTTYKASVLREQEMAAKRKKEATIRINTLRKQVKKAALQRAELLEASCRQEEKRAQQRLTRSARPAALQATKSELVLDLPRVPAPLVLRDQKPVKGPKSVHRAIQTPLLEDRPLSPFDFEKDFGLMKCDEAD